MKDRINFLTPLRAGEEFKNRARQVILVAAALGAGVIGVYFGVLQYNVGNQKKESSAMEAEVQKLKDLHALHAALDEKKEELLNRRERLRKLLEFQQGARSGKMKWSSILADLAQSLPPGVWLDRLEVKPSKTSPEAVTETKETGDGKEDAESKTVTPETRVMVTLSGKAFSQEELLDFLADMEQDPLWESATLKRSDREKNKTVTMPDLYRFEIILALAG